MENKVNELLKGLEKSLADGTFTPARYVDSETFICFTEHTPNGMLYHQSIFDTLPSHVKQVLNHRVRGERTGPFKVIAVFDFWMPYGLENATVKYPS